jgi:D-amino-acid oxidase
MSSQERLPEGIDRKNQKIIVVGAGIMGLTTGIQLLESGYKDVEIWGKERPGKVSRVASFWEPFASEPDKEGRDSKWGKDTYDKLVGDTTKGTPGLAISPGLSLFTGERADPDWSKYVPSYRYINDQKKLAEASRQHGVVLPDNISSGYTVEYPTFDMPPYLEHLMTYFTSLGGKILEREVSPGLGEALDEADTIVNCTGLAARELVFDHDVKTMRGQLVKVTKPQSVNSVIIDDECPEGMRNIMPHANHIMLGGTAEDSAEETPDPQTSKAILDRCRRLVPALKEAKVTENLVGLRPYRRTGIRVEPEDTGLDRSMRPGTKKVVHNYGHGGSGVTFSWGCANEVVRIIKGLT